MKPAWMKELLRAPDGGDGSMFKAGEGGDTPLPNEGGDTPPAESEGGDPTPAGDRPEWLPEKFKSPEDLAKSYGELERKMSTKNDLLKNDLRDEVMADLAKAAGVPEDIAGYEYPEGISPPSEAIDEGLRNWAKENNVGSEAFQSLINDVWKPTLPDPEAEKAALGNNADDRIEAASNFVVKNIDKGLHGEAARLMTTAAGVEFVEAMMKAASSSGFAPGDEGGQGEPLTRDGIREMQSDPRFGSDEAYTQKVRGLWQKFAQQQGGR